MTNTKEKNTPDKNKPTTYRPPPAFDPALFEDDLRGYEISEEDRLAFLETLWHIMMACVDMGWGLDPTQNICGQLIKKALEDEGDSPDMVESKDIQALSSCFDESSHNMKGDI